MANNEVYIIGEEQPCKCFCRKKFRTQKGLAAHIEDTPTCRAKREAKHGQFGKKPGVSMDKQLRLMKKHVVKVENVAKAEGKGDAAENKKNGKEKENKGKAKGKAKAKAKVKKGK